MLSRCRLLCSSLRFSFAHAWIFYQRGLIRIKCLKAFLTPGDVNAPWLDLQTKQAVMMQACGKMHAAVEQQMPSLDVFINVFSSSFHHAFSSLLSAALDSTLCLFLRRCRGTPWFLNSCRKTERNVSSAALPRKFPSGRWRHNQKYSNTLQSV